MKITVYIAVLVDRCNPSDDVIVARYIQLPVSLRFFLPLRVNLVICIAYIFQRFNSNWNLVLALL